MKKIVIVIICIFIIAIGYFYINKPKLKRIWVTQFLGSGQNSYGGMALDHNGHIYLTGITSENLDFGSKTWKNYFFIARYNVEGKRDWIKSVGPAGGYDECTDLAIDKSGNIYITGYKETKYDMNIAQLGVKSKKDIFLIKYDTNGSKIWERQYGSNQNDQSFDLAVDKLGNVIIVGSTAGTFEDQMNMGGMDILIMKCDSEGNAVWYKQYGTVNAEEAYGVGVDLSGNIYVTGFTEGPLSYNSQIGGKDIFLMKCNPSGEQIYVKQFGTSGEDDGRAIMCLNEDEIYLTGGFAGNDIAAARYNAEGKEVWIKHFGSNGIDIGQGICGDDQGKVYIIGMTNGFFKGNEDQKTRWDIVMLELNSQGKLKLLKQFGTKWQDYGKGIEIDAEHNVYLAGSTIGDFNNDTSELMEGQDIFLSKYTIYK